MNYFREVVRETKRLESVARSPVYALFSETLGGLSTIRAYGKTSKFINEFESKLNNNIQAQYCNKTAERWLSSRIELIGALVAGFTSIFATQVVLAGSTTFGSSSSYASLAGVALSFAISLCSALQFGVRSFSQAEVAMNSCERILHYIENTAQEAPMTSKELEKDSSLRPATMAVQASNGKVIYPSKQWPEKGSITLTNLKMRYRPETPLVLKGITINIAAGERIGIVGRTGSGKSSLLLNLMRIVEPILPEEIDDYVPPVTINEIDILRIGLFDLRSKIGVIPQSPVLFSGTIRSNMDPFDSFTDENIWLALDKCAMMKVVEEMPNGLSSLVAEYGENLSQGQRQLLCLGRALLKQCRILLLDEATSSVDYETDREIQRTIREAFKEITVLTIAHRVNTIMDSDKILVLDNGYVAEFASPQQLLQDEKSLFTEIVRHSQAEN